MSNSHDEPELGVSDDNLPDDLVPGEDNPLAEGLPAGESVDDLLADGKPAEQDSDSGVTDDPDGSDGPTQE